MVANLEFLLNFERFYTISFFKLLQSVWYNISMYYFLVVAKERRDKKKG